MARIAGIDLPREKRVEIALTYIFGIGRPTATKLLRQTGVDPDTRVKNLTDGDIQKLREQIEKNLKVEGDLRREVSSAIKRLMDIGSYRGVRHRRGLPVRGQRTKHERAQSQGAAEDRRRQEEDEGTGGRQVNAAAPKKRARRTKKREIKNVSQGIAHIHVELQQHDRHHHRHCRAARSPGRAPAAWALRAARNRRRSPRRWRPKAPRASRWSTA